VIPRRSAEGAVRCDAMGCETISGVKGRRGTPQIVAPGAIDMITFPSWRESTWSGEGRNDHAHNRLLASVTATPDERRRVARYIADKLSLAKGRTVCLVPQQGIEGWDREGEPKYAPDALTAFLDETRRLPIAEAQLLELDAHINDKAFADAALETRGSGRDALRRPSDRKARRLKGVRTCSMPRRRSDLAPWRQRSIPSTAFD